MYELKHVFEKRSPSHSASLVEPVCCLELPFFCARLLDES